MFIELKQTEVSVKKTEKKNFFVLVENKFTQKLDNEEWRQKPNQMYYFKNRTLAVTNANKLKYVKMLSWIIMPPSTSEPPDQLTSTPAASWGPREPCVLTQSRWHFLPKMSVVVGTTMKMLCKHVVMEMKLLNSNQWPTCFIRAVSHSIHGHSLSLSLWNRWGRPKIWPLMM